MLEDYVISELEHSDEVPERHEMPGNAHLLEGSLGEACAAALAVETEQEAAEALLFCTAIQLHAGTRISWKAAFRLAKEAIAWYAFACDVSKKMSDKFCSPTNSPHEVTEMRDLALRFYGARLAIWATKPNRRSEPGRELVPQRHYKINAGPKRETAGQSNLFETVE